MATFGPTLTKVFSLAPAPRIRLISPSCRTLGWEMIETTDAEDRLLQAVMVFLPNYRPGWSESDGTAQQSRLRSLSLSSVTLAAVCIVGACLLSAVIPGPPHLPVSLTPFYLGVAGAVSLGSFLGCRNTGWCAFVFALPVVYLDASVAAMVWTALTVIAFAAIASIGTPRNRQASGVGGRQIRRNTRSINESATRSSATGFPAASLSARTS